MLAIICVALVILQQVSTTPIPYKGFDLNKFTGKMLEVITTRIEFPNMPEPPVAYCSSQTFRKLPDGEFQIYSSARIGSVDGEKKEFTQAVKMIKPGLFDFQFKIPGVGVSIQYQIGPTNASGKYDYVVLVSEQNGYISIWVGAREADVFKSKYEASVKDYLETLIDEKWYKTAKLVSTYQGPDCK